MIVRIDETQHALDARALKAAGVDHLRSSSARGGTPERRSCTSSLRRNAMDLSVAAHRA